MSADGKIADYSRSPARFSSAQDLAHLEAQIADADAVLFGAGTLRAYGTCLPLRQPALIAQRQARRRRPQPVQIVCSTTGALETTLRFFQQPVPRWLLTTPTGAQAWDDASHFEQVLPLLQASTHWASVLRSLSALGIQRLSVLGGGLLVGTLIEQDLIDELYLTICPLLIGGQGAPTPADGHGLTVTAARRLQLVSVKAVGSEVFLHYCRCHPEED